MEQPATQTRIGAPGCIRLEDQRTDRFFSQGLIRLRIAEEMGDIDQHLLKERFNLLGMRLEAVDVLVQVFDQADFHAPLDAPQEGALLVQRKIVARF